MFAEGMQSQHVSISQVVVMVGTLAPLHMLLQGLVINHSLQAQLPSQLLVNWRLQ